MATKLGIALPRQQFSPAEAKEAGLRARLMDMHESACRFFEAQLPTPAAAAAREYLASRELGAEALKEFRVGYAPDSGFLLRDALKGEFDEAELKQSGLFSFKDEKAGVAGLYSKFRNRIIFPIANEQGRVIAFGGRILVSAGAADKDKAGPKYLNSPETPIYSKGRVLYNLDKAKEAIRKLDYSIVVEGYMDCISVYRAGMHNVFASSGTAFGETQVRLIGRHSKNIVVNFDPDTAGAAATERSLALLVEEDFNIKVITLEPGLDPDLYIRTRGVDAYQKEVLGSRKYFHYLIDRAQAQFPPRSPENKVKAINYLLPHVQRIPSRIVRDELASEIAQRLGIDSAVLRQELRSAATSRTQVVSAEKTQKATLSPAELVLIQVLAGSEGDNDTRLRSLVRDALLHERLHEGWRGQAVIEALLGASPQQLAEPLSLPLEDADRNLLAAALMQGGGAARAVAIGDAKEDDAEAPPKPVTEGEIRLALAALRRPHIERQLQKLQSQIDDASKRSDAPRLAQLSTEKMNLKRALDESMRASQG